MLIQSFSAEAPKNRYKLTCCRHQCVAGKGDGQCFHRVILTDLGYIEFKRLGTFLTSLFLAFEIICIIKCIQLNFHFWNCVRSFWFVLINFKYTIHVNVRFVIRHCFDSHDISLSIVSDDYLGPLSSFLLSSQ